MRVLVTGGGGFVGSQIVGQLLEGGCKVRVLDLRPTKHPADVELIHGDVREPATARRAVAGVDAVCHQAAMVGLGVDALDMPGYVGHNGLGTAVLLSELHRRGFDGRIVLASSMVVYGEGRYACAAHGLVAAAPRPARDLAAGRFDPPCPHCGAHLEPLAVPEDAPADPRNVYAATKLHQEHLCSSYARGSGAAVTALRYHNVYGPGMPRDTPYAGVASIFRSRIENGAAPLVNEDGNQLRDFVHVRDVARANVLALSAADPVAGPLNVASGRPRSVGALAAALHSALDTGGPEPQVTGDWRGGDVRHVFASVDRIREHLGFVAQVKFEDGIAELCNAGAAAET